MLVKAALVVFFVIPIVFLCGLFVYEAEKMMQEEQK